MPPVTVTVAINEMVVNKTAILEGNSITLSATVTPPLTPHYYIQWSFTASNRSYDNVVIIDRPSPPHYSLLDDGLSLRVTDVQPMNRGNYTFLLTNSVYETSATVFLDVLCKCFRLCVGNKLHKPSFIVPQILSVHTHILCSNNANFGWICVDMCSGS